MARASRERLLRLARALVLSVLFGGCGSRDGNSDLPSTFAIATGGPAGLYYPYGGGMAAIWSKHIPHINAKAEVTGGSVTNVIQVARQESEVGIAMADVVTSAYLGQGRFPEPLPLRVLFTAYPNVVHILTLEQNGVRTIADFRGKRVSLGAAGSGTAVAAENVITGLGVTLEEFSPAYLSFGETTSALKDGTIDAGFIVGGLGVAAVTELSVTRDLHLVALSEAEIERLHAIHPAYTGYRVPAQTYNGVSDEVQALGIWSAVVVHESLPTRTAYQLTCTLYQHRAALLKVTSAAQATTLGNIHQLPAVPLHPGSAAYVEAPTEDCLSAPDV
ncbi:MAG: TAXI family TRAP transporter solute-binding subunit [Pseudomonadota bacterium]